MLFDVSEYVAGLSYEQIWGSANNEHLHMSNRFPGAFGADLMDVIKKCYLVGDGNSTLALFGVGGVLSSLPTYENTTS